MTQRISPTLAKDSKRLFAFVLVTLSGFLALVGTVLQAMVMLNSIGVSDIFSALSLSSADKVKIPLYLTFSAASFAIALWAGGTLLRGYARRGGYIAGLAAVVGVVTLAFPSVLGYPMALLGTAILLPAIVLMGVSGLIGLRIRGVEVGAKKFLTTTDLATIAVFSALTAVLTASTGVLLPSPTGGYTNLGDTIIFVAALILGTKVGGIVGIIGPVAADLLVGYPRWFVTVLAHGGEGFVAGLGRKKGIVLQVVLLAVGGVFMATTYFFVNIFIKGYPVAVVSYMSDLFGQALISIILGLIATKAIEKALPQLLK